MSDTTPKYLPATILKRTIAPISTRRIREWARQGYVRVAKMGKHQQSTVMYCTDDVIAVLEAYAAGRTPTRRRR